jgi:hypothetical protein
MATQTSKRTTRAAAGDGHAATLADLSRQSERIGAELDELGDTAREMVDSARALIGEKLRRQPYAVLATALGVGYVLGGGLPRGVLRGLLVVGGRLMLENAVARVASHVTERR